MFKPNAQMYVNLKLQRGGWDIIIIVALNNIKYTIRFSPLISKHSNFVK